ncbi:MAG: SCP2 sterol-binding domain-containing protein [Chloroflexota bacterium]|nr:SCP2 sterol-binding domain-containing protein [Chloroflexota bacterium]
MHRRLNIDHLPNRRVVVQFDFFGARQGSYWLLLDRKQPSVCWDDPGLYVDVLVNADTKALYRVWLGHMSFSKALRQGQVRLEGPPEFRRAFPTWFTLSVFAGVRSAEVPSSPSPS